MEWQPIETAPRDGTRVLLGNGTLFAAGCLAHRAEGATKLLGYDEGVVNDRGWKMIGPRFSERVPNPDAGKRHEWWQLDNPSAFREEDSECPDHDGSFPIWEPTHWMPLPDAPKD